MKHGELQPNPFLIVDRALKVTEWGIAISTAKELAPQGLSAIMAARCNLQNMDKRIRTEGTESENLVYYSGSYPLLDPSKDSALVIGLLANLGVPIEPKLIDDIHLYGYTFEGSQIAINRISRARTDSVIPEINPRLIYSLSPSFSSDDLSYLGVSIYLNVETEFAKAIINSLPLPPGESA
jgi:hypothetical protein